MNFGPISSSFLPIFQKISRLNFIRLHSSGVIQSNMAEARSRDHCAVTSLCAARARLDQWEHSPRWSWPWHQSEARVEACWKCTLGAVPGASPPPPCPRQSTREVLNRVRAWHDRDRDNPASSASWSSKSLGGGMMSLGPWHLPQGSASRSPDDASHPISPVSPGSVWGSVLLVSSLLCFVLRPGLAWGTDLWLQQPRANIPELFEKILKYWGGWNDSHHLSSGGVTWGQKCIRHFFIVVKIFYCLRKEKNIFYGLFSLAQVCGMSSAAMYLIRKENLIIRSIQSADRYNEVTFSWELRWSSSFLPDQSNNLSVSHCIWPLHKSSLDLLISITIIDQPPD